MFWCVFWLLIYAALQMSVQDANMSSDSDMSKVFEDRSFVTSILNSVRFSFKPLITYRYSFSFITATYSWSFFVWNNSFLVLIPTIHLLKICWHHCTVRERYVLTCFPFTRSVGAVMLPCSLLLGNWILYEITIQLYLHPIRIYNFF